MEIVRLGQGVDRTGRSPPEALERTFAALPTVRRRDRDATAPSGCGSSRHRDPRRRATATSSSRRARRARRRRPRWSRGDEEAALSFAGRDRASSPAAESADRRSWWSTSAAARPSSCSATTTARRPARSVDIGCVRLTERHLHGRPADGRGRSLPPTPTSRPRSTGCAEPCRWHAAADPGRAVPARSRRWRRIALGLPTLRPASASTTRGSAGRQVVRLVAERCSRCHGASARRVPVHAPRPGRRDRRGCADPGDRAAPAGAADRRSLVSEHDILDGIAWSIAAA